jgi:RHS repeat-associated protein
MKSVNFIFQGRSYDSDHNLLSSSGPGTTIYGFDEEHYDSYINLLNLRARQLNTATGRFLTKDTWAGNDNTPESYNSWLYGYANPVVYTDPSGKLSCWLNSDDPMCINGATLLLNKARAMKEPVNLGQLEPVEAFAQLADEAYWLFDHDHEGIMWGMTNVLLGFDPNEYIIKAIAPVQSQLGIGWNSPFGETHKNKYNVDMNWLPYRRFGNSSKDILSTDGSYAIYSEIGDWNPNYFDGTANQAFHFWEYAASSYYDGPEIALIGNAFHDPYFLECLFGKDLIDLKDKKIKPWVLQQALITWSKNTIGTSKQDFDLGLKGIEFGQEYINLGSGTKILYSPGTWIRNNLQSK